MIWKNGHAFDYAYKSEIMKNHPELLQEQKLISRALFVGADVIDHRTGEVMTFERAEMLDMVLENDPAYIECRKINQSSYQRSKRLRNRIEYFLKLGECVFLTLTFTDDVLSSTSRETRRKYVQRFLRSQSENYIANIDFGAQNGREHYHALVVSDGVQFSPWHEYGAIKGEKVRVSEQDPNGALRLAKYVSKLTNHAIKETTKRNAIIYSR